MKAAQDVLDYLRERERALIGFLERLARAESPSAEPASQDEVLGILSEALTELGYATLRVPGRTSGAHLYATPPTARVPHAGATPARTLRHRLAAGDAG